jgi:hypothetical protein
MPLILLLIHYFLSHALAAALPTIYEVGGLTYDFSSLAAHPRGLVVLDNNVPPWSYHVAVGRSLEGASLFSPKCHGRGAALAFQITGAECYSLGAPAAPGAAPVPLDAGGLGVALSYSGGDACPGDVKRSVRVVFECAACGGAVCDASQREEPACVHTIVVRGELGCPIECPTDAAGKVCAGHGTCVARQPPPATKGKPGASVVACACDPGFSGAACEGVPVAPAAEGAPYASGSEEDSGVFLGGGATAGAFLLVAASRYPRTRRCWTLIALGLLVASSVLLLLFAVPPTRVPTSFRSAPQHVLLQRSEAGPARNSTSSSACASSPPVNAGVCECLAWIKGCSPPTDDGAGPGTLLTMFDDNYDSLVRNLWLPRARELGYAHAAGLKTRKGAPALLIGGPRGAFECPLRYQFADPPSFGFVGDVKFALIYHALHCQPRGAVIFSEADVVVVRDPMEFPVRQAGASDGAPLVPAREYAGDVLVSGHARDPQVNIGFMMFFPTDASAASLLAFLHNFHAVSYPWPFDQAVFDALLGNVAAADAWDKTHPLPPSPTADDLVRPGPVPDYARGIAPLAARGVHIAWGVLPPSAFLELAFASIHVCWPLLREGCWSGNVSSDAAVAVHFTCLPKEEKVANMVQFYRTRTCARCDDGCDRSSRE